MSANETKLLLLAAAAVIMLVLLVTRLKINAFIALVLAALVVGAGSGLKMVAVVAAFQEGMGKTLGGIAAIIGLGTMLGKLLAESGGAEVLAKRFSAFFGPSRVQWCIMALAIAIGLTTWFAVGLVLLLPILLTLTKETKLPFLTLAIPLLSCLSVMHGVMPPHPGPVVAVDALGANTGKVLLWGFVIGLPTAAIAGPIFARWAVQRVPAAAPTLAVKTSGRSPNLVAPGFWITLFSILLPVLLMLVTTIGELLTPKGAHLNPIVAFIGNPNIALLVAVLFCLWSLGTRIGFESPQLLKFTEESIASIGMTLLVVGGGGGFARVLKESGVADAIGALALKAHLPPMLYGWLVAALIRVSVGSATVAITMASGLLAPVVAQHPGVNRELIVVAIGCGSLFLSHLNDAGFWIVKDCLGLTVNQTLRTWTVTETIVGIIGLLLSLVASFFF